MDLLMGFNWNMTVELSGTWIHLTTNDFEWTSMVSMAGCTPIGFYPLWSLCSVVVKREYQLHRVVNNSINKLPNQKNKQNAPNQETIQTPQTSPLSGRVFIGLRPYIHRLPSLVPYELGLDATIRVLMMSLIEILIRTWLKMIQELHNFLSTLIKFDLEFYTVRAIERLRWVNFTTCQKLWILIVCHIATARWNDGVHTVQLTVVVVVDFTFDYGSLW